MTTKTSMHSISPRNMPHACKNGCANFRIDPSVLSDVIVSAHLRGVFLFKELKAWGSRCGSAVKW
jgi:hypothetical protein